MTRKTKKYKIKINGFTLVELLAVIVILAIIALIATPIILGIIKDTKKEADQRSVEMYVDAVEQAIVRENMKEEFKPKECEITSEGVKCYNYSELLNIDVDGEVPINGTIIIDNGMVSNGTQLKFKDFKAMITEEGILIEKMQPVPEAKSFSEDSWKTIISNIRAGNLEKYKIGDTKMLPVSKYSSSKIRIVNTTTPIECRGEGFSQTACGFVLEFEGILTEREMTADGTNLNGWKDSIIRNNLAYDVFNDLPKELQEIIIETSVVSGYSQSNNNENFYTIDKFYLLSPKEIYGINPQGDNLTKTRQLDYYKKENVSLENYSKAAKKYNGNYVDQWLRDTTQQEFSFFVIDSNGSLTNYDADFSIGVSFAFRIG